MIERDAILVEMLSRRGAVKKIAEACGISKCAVSQWRRVPAHRVEVVARVMGVLPRELRPDLAAVMATEADAPITPQMADQAA